MPLTTEQRVSRAPLAESPPLLPQLHGSRTSDLLVDLRERHAEPARENVEPHVPGYRTSARSTESLPANTVDAFNFDLLEAWEDEQDHAQDLPSPSASVLPPRVSSLATSPPPGPAQSPEHTCSTDPEPPLRHRSFRQARPHPIKLPELESVWTELPQVQSARLLPTPSFLETDPSQGTFKKKHRRHMTVSESKRAARSTIIVSHPSGMFKEHDLPPIPGLSPSTSIATSALSPVPGTPASATALPSEDQIRRELEMLALQDGADPLLTHRYGGRVDSELVMKLEKQDEADHDFEPRNSRAERPRPVRSSSDAEDRIPARRRRTIVEYLGRRSPVDKLLDLYLDEEKLPEKLVEASSEAQPVKRKQSLARRMTLTLRGSPRDKRPEIPPLPLPPQVPAGMI